MATRHNQGGASAPSVPLDTLLSAIPGLPRAVLDRLTAQLIDRLDEMDGDADDEDSDLGAQLMVAEGTDYDPAEDEVEFDGLAGDPTDAEDDDPGGGNVTDEPHDPEEDFGGEELGEDAQGGDVCDDTRPIADPAAYRDHVKRLQRERAFPVRPRTNPITKGYQVNMLYREPTTPTVRNILRRKRGLPRSPRA